MRQMLGVRAIVGLAWLLTASAHASAPVHLSVGELKLAALAEPPVAARWQLVAPCLGCSNAAPVHLTGLVEPSPEPTQATQPQARPVPRAPAGPSPATLRAQQLANAMYIGDTWSFRGGRELSLHLTPNQGHCAPLMRLTF